ncbi:MAG: patatin family protein, partial [Methylocystaceae bacterium]|nr:patatin family protein [Methylocystaceae bacterium]
MNYYGIQQGGMLPATSALLISGGGDNGAFGAGLLAGWSAHGDRPVFRSVTGVSTGALIAPFAFLGPEYDKTLTQLYTAMDAAHVFHQRFIPLAATVQDALSDTDPLFQT